MIPGQVRQRNLVDRALSEDLKNDAIRNATLTMASINYVNSNKEINQVSQADMSYEQIILDVLETSEWLTFGRLCAKSDIPAEKLKTELARLLDLEVIRAGSNDEGVIIYRLL